MVRDIAGQASLEEVTVAMSALADLAVAQAYRSALVRPGGRAWHRAREAATGCPQEMIVVGMGKLGGEELNVSSDIDLVMLYETRVKPTAQGRSVITNSTASSRSA